MAVSIRWRIAGLVALYAILAALWIWLSDGVVALLASTPARLTQLQTVKGWAFVAVTAALFGLILRHEMRVRMAREDALRDSEETYRTLVEVESDAVFLIDNATGQLLATNPAAAQLYGYTQAELLGLRNTDLSAEPAETARVTTSTPLTPDTVVRIPLRCHKKRDGTVFPVEITGRFFTWRGRSVHLAAIRDITDRKEAEAALARYRLLAEQARDIVLFVRRDGRILEANQAAVRVYGYTAGEFVTLHIQDLRAPETQTLTAEQMAQADTEGILFETVHRRKDGTTFPVEVSSRGADLGGERVLLSIIRDITDRQRAARALATRSRQLEAVQAIGAEVTRELDLARLLGLVIDRAVSLLHGVSGAVYLVDPATEDVTAQAWVGHGEWLAGTRLGRGEGLVGAVIQRGEGIIENAYRTSAYAVPVFLERTRHTAVLGEPLRYRDRIIGAVLVDRNTDPFTEPDRDLLRLFADQAAIAIEHARLYNDLKRSYEDLRYAQDELVRAEKLRGLGQMAAGIAHDLNNTLATILGQVELLRLQARPPEIEEGLQMLQTAATDGAAVVRRLQDFARQRGAGPLQPCDLNQLVWEALELTRPRWQEEPRRKGCVIEPVVGLEGLPLVEGNPAEIREALTNLIFNAVDAMPTGGHLRFTGHAVEAMEGDLRTRTPHTTRSPAVARATAVPTWVDVTVADTGIGMDDAIRGRIFDPFFTTKGLHGTGLGLSVVYGIMERHGGRIDVASVSGKGTTFRLRFRVAPREVAASASRPTWTPVPSRRILLVDDDASVRRTLASLLRASDQEVFEADSGTEALRWLETTALDLVLTDLGMPEVTGWDVARAAKATRPDLPVVLLTGWGEHARTEAPPDVRVDRVLTKPVPRSAVLAVIAELAGPS